MRAAAVALLALLLAGPALAQEVDADSSEAVPDEVFEAVVEDGGDPEILLDALLGLRENPLDVNAASAADLSAIPALGGSLAAEIVLYRTANGPFVSLPQIQLVPGVTPDVYAAARPYLTIGPTLAVGAPRTARRFPVVPTTRTVVSGLRTTVTQRVTRRLSEQAGYVGPDSLRDYAGGPERIYTRATAAYRRNVSVNVTLETDPGEAFRWDPGTGTYGYDYVSMHAAVMDVGRIDALVVGDFIAEFGQGVALWRASGFGKGPDAVGGPGRVGRGIRPYGSVDENNFFRGAALSLSLTPRLVATAFASRRTLDASLGVPDSLDLADPDLPPGALDGTLVTSLSADGLHRTERELERKDALGETLVGAAAEYRLTTGRVDGRAGVVATHGRYDSPLAEGTRPDNRFGFAGDRATTISAYADARTRDAQVFGEVAPTPAPGPTSAAAPNCSSSAATTGATSRRSTATRSASATASATARRASTSGCACVRRARGRRTSTTTSTASTGCVSTSRARASGTRRSRSWSTARAATRASTCRRAPRRARRAATCPTPSPARSSAGWPTRRARRSASTASGTPAAVSACARASRARASTRPTPTTRRSPARWCIRTSATNCSRAACGSTRV